MAANDVNLNIKANTKQASKTISKFETSATKSLTATETAALNTAKAFAAIGVAVGGFAGVNAAVRQLAEFNNAVTEIETIAGDAVKSNLELSRSLVDVAAQFGKAPTEQAQSFYSIISAGVTDATKAQETLVAANKLAIGGLATTTQSVDILTSALNVYKKSNLSAAEAADILFTAVKLGKTNVAALAGSLGGVLPVANSLGVSFSDTAATIATLTAKGIPTTAEAVTGLKSLFNSLILSQKKLQGETDEIRDAFSLASLETKGLTQFLKDANEAVGGNTEKILELLGSSEALVAFLALAGDGFESLGNAIEESSKSAGAADAAYRKVNEAVGRQLEILANNFKTFFLRLSIEFGDSLSDLLQTINAGLRKMIAVAPKMAKAAKAIAVAVAELAAAYVALKTAMFAIDLASSAILFVRFAGGIREAITAAKALTKAYKSAAAAQAIMLGKTALIAAAFVSIAAAIDFTIRNWGNLDKILKRGVDTSRLKIAEKHVEDLKKQIKEAENTTDDFTETIQDAWGNDLVVNSRKASDHVGDLKKALELATKEVETLKKETSVELDVDTGFLGQLYDRISAIFDVTQDTKKELKELKDFAQEALDAAAFVPEPTIQKSTFQSISDTFSSALFNGMEQIRAPFQEMIKAGTEKGLSTGAATLGAAGQALAGIFKDGKGAAKAVATTLVAGAAEFAGMLAGIPGLGGLVGPIAGALAAGPEMAKQQAEAFAQSLPQTVENMVEGLIEGLPHLIDSLVDVLINQGGLVRIMDALIRMMPRLSIALAESTLKAIQVSVWRAADIFEDITWVSFRDAVTRFLNKFGEGIDNFMRNLINVFNFLPDSLSTLFNSFLDALADIFNRAKNTVGIGGGVSDAQAYGAAAVAGLGGPVGVIVNNIPGLATGGLITDDGLATLHEGELVIPRDTSERILSGDGSGMNAAVMAQILTLLQQPIHTTATATIDGDAFADIQLRLDRTAARTAA